MLGRWTWSSWHALRGRTATALSPSTTVLRLLASRPRPGRSRPRPAAAQVLTDAVDLDELFGPDGTEATTMRIPGPAAPADIDSDSLCPASDTPDPAAEEPVPPPAATSSAAKGQQFEHEAVAALQRLGLRLVRCGGPHDRGVDFRGTWTVGGCEYPVVGQCKREVKKASTGQLREFLGVLLGGGGVGSGGGRTGTVVGVFASSAGYSEAARHNVLHYDVPMALCVVRDAQVTQFVPNRALRRLMPGLVVRQSPSHRRTHAAGRHPSTEATGAEPVRLFHVPEAAHARGGLPAASAAAVGAVA